jgi:hypothetical protein
MSDYSFVTGQSEVPIAFSSIVSSARTNQDSSAKAQLRSDGFEVIPFKAIILPVPQF